MFRDQNQLDEKKIKLQVLQREKPACNQIHEQKISTKQVP